MIDLNGFTVKVAPDSSKYQQVALQPQVSFRDLDMQRILVMRLDSIGDMVLMGPALRSLRQALPEAHITLMASPAGSQAAPMLPWIDDLIVSEALWQDSSGKVRLNPERELGLIEQMSAGAYTTALIFTRFSQSPLPAAYACYLAGIPNRLGFSHEFSGGVLSFGLSCPDEELHQAERNLALLRAIDIPLAGTELELHIPPAAEESVNQLLGGLGMKPAMPFIVLAPGAGATARRYSPERYAQVLRLLAIEAGIPILITGSPEEAESLEPITNLVSSLPEGTTFSLVGRITATELAALIRKSSLTITNNSAALHIADAFRRPIVALYSGTDMVGQWMPRSARARLLCRPVFCSPCHNHECPFQMECLDIRPDEVAIAALEMLAERIFFRTPARRAGAEI